MPERSSLFKLIVTCSDLYKVMVVCCKCNVYLFQIAIFISNKILPYIYQFQFDTLYFKYILQVYTYIFKFVFVISTFGIVAHWKMETSKLVHTTGTGSVDDA